MYFNNYFQLWIWLLTEFQYEIILIAELIYYLLKRILRGAINEKKFSLSKWLAKF